jgi:hypothetical protein
MRRSIVETVGPFYEAATHAFDTQYLLRLFLKGLALACPVPDYGVRYRIHTGGITKKPALVQHLIQSRLQVVDWLYGQNNLPLDVLRLKSWMYLATYLRTARLQLFEGRSRRTLEIAQHAFRDSNVALFPCLMQFLPLMILAWMPRRVYRLVFNTAKNMMNGYGQTRTRLRYSNIYVHSISQFIHPI